MNLPEGILSDQETSLALRAASPGRHKTCPFVHQVIWLQLVQ